MNKGLLIKLLKLHAQHNSKLDAHEHLDFDYFHIDLFGVVMQEIGLPAGAYEYLEVIFNDTFIDKERRYIDESEEFFDGNKPSIEAFFERALKQAELYQEGIKDQSRSERTRRLLDGRCPIHDLYMCQVDDWYDEHGQEYLSVGCDISGCSVRAIVTEGQPLMLLGSSQHLLD